MNKNDIAEASLDRPSRVQIIISRFKDDDGEAFDGWECDIFHEDEYIGGGTSPTQAGAYDLANEIIWDYENPSYLGF